jgi:hypothetical protein
MTWLAVILWKRDSDTVAACCLGLRCGVLPLGLHFLMALTQSIPVLLSP